MPSGSMLSRLGGASLQSSGGLLSRYSLLSHRVYGGRCAGEFRLSRSLAATPVRSAGDDAIIDPSGGDSDAEDLFSGLSPAKPGDLFAWVEQQAADVEKKSLLETLEAEQARSVGLHLRGKAVVREGLVNEDDPARHFWHRKLALLAQQGDYVEAEAVMDDMARSGFVPGPRAYHALIFSHVKGDNAAGALAAIRTEFTAGIQPLSESYAAVIQGFLMEGDIDKAEAVYASNRRAGVDSHKSWLAVTAAMFVHGEMDRALALLAQGEEEGMSPDSEIYRHIITHLCNRNELDAALARLIQMKEGNVPPELQHYSPIIRAESHKGDVDVAKELIVEMLETGRVRLAGSTGIFNALLEGYLRQGLPAATLAEKMADVQRLLLHAGIAPDRKTYSLQLEACVEMDDAQKSVMAFRALKQQDGVVFQHVSDEMLGALLLLLSKNEQPADLYDVLSSMSRESRSIPSAALIPGDSGCTPLGLWLHTRLQRAAPQMYREIDDELSEEGFEPAEVARVSPWLVVDDVNLDALSLYAVDADGNSLVPSKMSVRELRAELLARRYPVYGTKKDLSKRLQKARKAADKDASSDLKQDTKEKIEVIVTEQQWRGGKLVDERMYQGEALMTLETDENEDEGDLAEDNEDTRRQGRDDDDDSEDEADYEQTLEAILKAQGQGVFEFLPRFSNSSARAQEAMEIYAGAMKMGAVPCSGDVNAVVMAIELSGDVGAAAKALTLLDNLGDTTVYGDFRLRLAKVASAVSIGHEGAEPENAD